MRKVTKDMGIIVVPIFALYALVTEFGRVLVVAGLASIAIALAFALPAIIAVDLGKIGFETLHGLRGLGGLGIFAFLIGIGLMHLSGSNGCARI